MKALKDIQAKNRHEVAVKMEPLLNYTRGEEHHQKYLDKQYHVTQESGTEPPFQNEYWNEGRKGIYVEITTEEHLFVSGGKFESGGGWSSFFKPIQPAVITEHEDSSHFMARIVVRSKSGNAYLGHVIDDGPVETGGLRYCINSAALRFIPEEKMAAAGYGEFTCFVE